jgi:Putative addiction module component
MNNRVKQLFDQAQQLSPEEQAELLDLLIASAPEPAPGWDKAWAEECERRAALVDRGEAELYPADEVLAQLRAKCV